MELQWRGKTYTFKNRTLEGKRDIESARSNVENNIYAFDTESVAKEDRYEPICFQISSPFEGESLMYVPERGKALEYFIHHFVKNYSFREFETHHVFMYAHNLTYDWVQLTKLYPDLVAITKTGIGLPEDYLIYETPEYKVILRKKGLFLGTAPHFTIKVQMSKREWVDISFRDTFSYFTVSLSTLAKDLGLEVQKMERQSDIGLRDYRLEGDSEDKQYFEKYSKIDAKATRLAAEKIRELHLLSGMTKIRVSSPGYAINKMLHVIPDGTEICAGCDDQSIMQLVVDSYAGGRTGGVYHGKVSDISVLDFHSSYPASMTCLPSFAPTMQYIRYDNPEELGVEELLEIINECHCFLRVSGRENDSKYPALITSIKNKLVPIYGDFENIATTGVELYVGVKSGTLEITKVHELVCLVEMEQPTCYPFKIFIESAYTRKEQSEKGSSEYTSAKLEMNGSYGKLIESRNETPVEEAVRDIILPYVEGMESSFGEMYYKEYIETLNEDSDIDFKNRYPQLCEEILEQFEDEELSFANFGFLSLTKLEYGRYVVPAAAALITGISRARLLVGMKALQACYWDTDSLFIHNYNPTTVNQTLSYVSDWLPEFVTPVRVGDNLGELDCELEHASGYLAGTKRYYLDDGKGGKKSIKKAMHGIQSVPFDIAEDIIKSLATGKNLVTNDKLKQVYSYGGRARPLGVREAKTVSDMGKFTVKTYESQFRLDNRLYWKESGEGWDGTIKELLTIQI
jgi:hypothetical protein